jgi:hypothetical protein
METDNNSKKKFILITLGLATTGVLSYLGWEYWQSHKVNQHDEGLPEPPINADTTTHYTPPTLPQPAADFPIKKGSRGEKVRAIQTALIAKYGKSILPKYGADGDYGSEMEAALLKSNLPTSVDESNYNLLVKGNSPDGSSLAQKLVNAAISSNYKEVMNALSQLRNTGDYQTVSATFKTYRVHGVHQTLVNGLLNSFNDESKKQQIRLEFLRMGLKYDGNKWALNGIDDFGYSLHW